MLTWGSCFYPRTEHNSHQSITKLILQLLQIPLYTLKTTGAAQVATEQEYCAAGWPTLLSKGLHQEGLRCIHKLSFFVSSASRDPRNVAKTQPKPPSECMDLEHWLLESLPDYLHTSRAQIMHTWYLGGKMNTHLKYRKGKGEASVDSFLFPTWTDGHAVRTPEPSLPNFWSSPLFQESVESLGKFFRPTSYPCHWHDLRRIEAGSATL